jgi:MFS family permease
LTTRVDALLEQHDAVPVAVVLALGLTQVIGYGTLYYSFSILAPDMARDLGWPLEHVFAVFSASLLVGGIAAPLLGRWMDRFGAATLMAIGSAIAALTLALCAWSPSMIVFTLSLIMLEIASGMVQYQAAFAALVEIRPRSAARSITYLTLLAGFASTLFWPITTGLHAYFSWREIYLIYAGLNLVLCLPLHAWMTRHRRTSRNLDQAQGPVPVIGALAQSQRRRGFYLVAAAFALQGFTLSAVLVHMVPMLTAIGFGATAVMVGALFGPAQVASRLVNMLFGSGLTPPALATLSAILIVGAVVVLQLSGTWFPGAVAFAVMLGLGSGINSIAQGSLPLWLFGSEGYGALTGRMAAVRLIAGAAAPFAFSFLVSGIGIGGTLAINAGLGTLGIIAFLAIALASRPAPA